MNVTQEQITEFFKKHFSDFVEELEQGQEIMLVQDENLEDEDNEVINYLEYHCISYTNEEILKMIKS